MLTLGLLLAQRVSQILVETAIPRTLNQPSAGRVVASGCECETGVPADAVDGLHERFPECGFANDERAIVVLQRTAYDLGGARAIAVHEHDDRQMGVLALFSGAIFLIGG